MQKVKKKHQLKTLTNNLKLTLKKKKRTSKLIYRYYTKTMHKNYILNYIIFFFQINFPTFYKYVFLYTFVKKKFKIGIMKNY